MLALQFALIKSYASVNHGVAPTSIHVFNEHFPGSPYHKGVFNFSNLTCHPKACFPVSLRPSGKVSIKLGA